MSEPLSRYRPSRQFLWAGFVALAIALFSGWVALRWEYAWIAGGLALASAILLLLMALAPAVEIYDSHVRFGSVSIPWAQIRRLDRSMLVPLVVRVTLLDKSQVTLFYAGDPESTNNLLRQLRRLSREALIDGVPYRQFWGETAPERKQLPPPRYPLLLPDDEAEIEQMFQQLKTAGRLDQPGADPKGANPKSSTPKGTTPKTYGEEE